MTPTNKGEGHDNPNTNDLEEILRHNEAQGTEFAPPPQQPTQETEAWAELERRWFHPEYGLLSETGLVKQDLFPDIERLLSSKDAEKENAVREERERVVREIANFPIALEKHVNRMDGSQSVQHLIDRDALQEKLRKKR